MQIQWCSKFLAKGSAPSKNAWERSSMVAHVKRIFHKTIEPKFHKIEIYQIKRSIKISVALVRERTIPTERPPPVGEVSANFCG